MGDADVSLTLYSDPVEALLVERLSPTTGTGRLAPVRQHVTSARTWWAFFLLGCLNNFTYVLVLSGAQSLADSFNESKLIGAINWASVGLGFVVRGANAYLVHSWSFHTRVGIAAFLMLIGLIGVSASKLTGSFWFAIGAICIIGASSSFGESVLLGYLKNFPSKHSGGWSSGTGMAGVTGSALYLALSAANLSNSLIFGAVSPLALVYFAVFVWMVQHPPAESRPALPTPSHSPRALNGEPAPPRASSSSSANPRAISTDSVDGLMELPRFAEPSSRDSVAGQPFRLSRESWAQRNMRLLRLVWFVAINLLLVYFFEYVISVGFAARANGTDDEQKHSSHWIIKHSYATLSFCYQSGVLLSRSSLGLFRIRRVQLLTLGQACFFVLWLFIALDNFVSVWVQLPLMFLVGLLGGAMYVNVFALLVDDERIPEVDKELAINLVALAINFGIIAASVFDLVMDATFLKPPKANKSL